MPTMTMEIKTDANGRFARTVPYNPPGPFAVTVSLTAKLLSPFATGLWGSLDIEPADGRPANRRKAFVAWQSEVVPLGSWHLGGGDNVIVVAGTTRPRRANARLVVEIHAVL